MIEKKLEALRKEIAHYYDELSEATKPQPILNDEHIQWLNGLISGLQRAECILDELLEEQTIKVVEQMTEEELERAKERWDLWTPKL